MGDIKDLNENDALAVFVPTLTPFITPPKAEEMVNEESSLKEIIKEDVQHMNNALLGVYAGWSQANSIAKICKLASVTSQLVADRRKLLLKPATYKEHKENKGPQKKTFTLESL